MRWFQLSLIAVLPVLAGCQAGIMVTRVLFGDQQIPSAFEAATHVRLDDQELPVFLICTAPSITTDKYESLALDLPDELSRRMKLRGIKTEDTYDAMSVIADLGGRFDAHRVAEELDPGYLAHIDFERYSLTEDNGNTLYRGTAAGTLTVFEITKSKDSDTDVNAVEIFRRGFETTYPGSHPVPVDQTPEKVFRKRFLDHLADQTGRLLYRYRMSDTL